MFMTFFILKNLWTCMLCIYQILPKVLIALHTMFDHKRARQELFPDKTQIFQSNPMQISFKAATSKKSASEESALFFYLHQSM